MANMSSIVRVEEPEVPNTPGRLATRLIKDWFAGRLLNDGENEGVYNFACPALRDPFGRVPDADSDHELAITQSQSYDQDHDPEGKGGTLLSCMCRFCRHHFVFRISQGLCGSASANMMHHFLPAGMQWFDNVTVENLLISPLFPLKCKIAYRCSDCGQDVLLEITVPRLAPEWIKMITDEQRIRESLRVAREEDPERYHDVGPAREDFYATTSLSTLNQYLKNVLDGGGSGARKRISFRNKTFSVQFGPACKHIFEYLGFEVEFDEETGDHYWLPPQLPPQEGKTPLGSRRAFYEDVRSEVQSLLDETPPSNQPVVRPISAKDPLERALGCDNANQRRSRLPVDNDEAADFQTLGATTDSDESMLKYAYSHQIRTDPSHKNVYLEALGRLAGRREMDLQLFVFKQQEDIQAQFAKRNPAPPGSDDITDKAYAHFGLSKDSSGDAVYFINVYKTYREQSPAQKSQHRLNLLRIGKHRKSQAILDEVYKTEMEPTEAYSYLAAEPTWPMESIAVLAQSSVMDTDLQLAIMALDAISRDRPLDDPTRPAFETICADLRSQLPQPNASLTDETELPGLGSTDMGIPVGLGNLRNTCYLNSILQYFYSVNAVRDLALSSDQPALEPSEQGVRTLLGNIDASDLEPGGAFVGHEFSRELSVLFRTLEGSKESSITPKQRLANAALLRPEKLRTQSANAAGMSDTATADAPPLPPRAGENSELKILVDPALPSSETASDVSSQTLVNQPDDESSYVVVGHATQKPNSVAADADMIGELPASDLVGSAGDAVPDNSKLTIEELAAELDKPNVGSDQMDVDEVMGNAIDHLRAAFKVTRIGASDNVPDPIEQAFFSTFIDNRKKVGEAAWNRSTRSDRWVTAFPAKSGSRDLYDALANSFDLEPLAPDLLTFTTIERPAPNFHICIQRSDGVGKNANPIIIPETLYLDRFMHTSEGDSKLFSAKKRAWDVKTRLNEVLQPVNDDAPKETSMNGTTPTPKLKVEDIPNKDDVDEYLRVEVSDVPALRPAAASEPDAEWSIINSAIKEILTKHPTTTSETSPMDVSEPDSSVERSTAIPSSELEGFWDEFNQRQTSEKEMLMLERAAIFDSMHRVPYRLHAVVCHAGSTASAGHYWVWIHDFEQDIWRKYNDTRVSVHSEESVFEELNTKGEPYYLAYVLAKDAHQLVSIPRRRQPTPESQPQGIQPPDGDFEMTDVRYKKTAAEHVEDIGMDPLPYVA
ncbi:hypothetical protein B0T24DRAFT_228485 [Lasiosphaeria ovina]|uniref:ubiquitinyl hydrolase 1 n=1 Tax=Lasiosphaeria ovina TaxID=92902 RepID=A0AAE0KHB1_9PEZI|nr:hypothetical protein B0T24DRAFT_228485 [Lasiosphaeria ovina]